jgi:hypothetical protein
MDFIVGLPRTQKGYNSIWVVVDRLTKVAHFIPVNTTYSGARLAELYISSGRMHNWSEQEEKMRKQFPRRNDSNLRHPNDNRNDKSQRDYSGPSRKRKPNDLITAVDHPS